MRISNKKPIVNEAIIAKELRVIGQDDTLIGILSKAEALSLAKKDNLDLVLVAAKTQPPTAKIVNWGKYNYQKKKKQQALQTNINKSKGLKQMRFGVKIGQHDLNTKLKKVNKFLNEGSKVKISIVLRGREMQHKDLAFELAQDIVLKLKDTGVLEQEPRLIGRQVHMVIRSQTK